MYNELLIIRLFHHAFHQIKTFFIESIRIILFLLIMVLTKVSVISNKVTDNVKYSFNNDQSQNIYKCKNAIRSLSESVNHYTATSDADTIR